MTSYLAKTWYLSGPSYCSCHKMLSLIVLTCIGFAKANGCLFTESDTTQGNHFLFAELLINLVYFTEKILTRAIIEDCPLTWVSHNCEILIGEFVRKSLRSPSSANGPENISIRNGYLVIDACKAEGIDKYQSKVVIHEPHATYSIRVSSITVH